MGTIQENIKAKKEREAKAAKSEKKRWIFKSLNNMTLIVRSRQTKYVYGAAGEVINTHKTLPVKVVFQNGSYELSDDLRGLFEVPVEDVATMMVSDPQHGKSYRLIWGPEETMKEVYGFTEPNEEMLNYAERANQVSDRRGGRFSQGVRSQKTLAR